MCDKISISEKMDPVISSISICFALTVSVACIWFLAIHKEKRAVVNQITSAAII